MSQENGEQDFAMISRLWRHIQIVENNTCPAEYNFYDILQLVDVAHVFWWCIQSGGTLFYCFNGNSFFLFFLRQSGKGQAGISNLYSSKKISETQQRQKQKHSVTGLMFESNVLVLFLM